MITRKEIVELVEQNGGEWKPEEGVNFKIDESQHIECYITIDKITHRFMCFNSNEIDAHAWCSDSIVPKNVIKYWSKYLNVVGIDFEAPIQIKTEQKIVEVDNKITGAKLEVYEKIFGDSSEIIIKQK